MKLRALALALAVLASVVVAAPVFAKGADKATITGPGLDEGGLTFVSNDEGNMAEPLNMFASETAIMAAMFRQTPDPLLSQQPTEQLGPRYTITYRVPGPNVRPDRIRQDLFPYARGGPVLYTKPGQRLFGTERTHGGWYVAHPDLKDMLVEAGLPASSPSAGSGDGFTFSTDLKALAVTVGLLLLLGAALFYAARRRIGVQVLGRAAETK